MLSRLNNHVTSNVRQGQRLGNCSYSRIGNIWSVDQFLKASEATNWYLQGVAELLIFHPVDTVAKRLMSNKAKVRFPPTCGNILRLIRSRRYHSRHFRPFFSVTPPPRRLQGNSYHFSLVLDMLLAIRSRSACINLEGSHGSTTCSTSTTRTTSPIPLANGKER